jgi:hypothetical protein
MKKLFFLFFLFSCSAPGTLQNSNILPLKFNDKLSFKEFDRLLKQYTEKSFYPNIDD